MQVYNLNHELMLVSDVNRNIFIKSHYDKIGIIFIENNINIILSYQFDKPVVCLQYTLNLYS